MRYIIVAIFLIFSGCSLKPDAQDTDIINKFLIPIPENKQNTQLKEKNIKIAFPIAPKYLYSNEITYTKGNGVYGSYLYNFWDETPAKQIQFILSNTLSGIYKNVFIETSAVHVDMMLKSRISVFEYILHDDISQVRFKIRLFLVDLDQNRVIKSREFYIAKDVKEKNPKGIVLGFKEVMETFNDEVYKWLSFTKYSQ